VAQPNKRPSQEPDESLEHPAKRERLSDSRKPPQPAPTPSLPASSSAPLSALEQMELFEKRLKTQAKLKPAKKESMDNVDSNKARTINNQMDWECQECGQFNFARSVICHACKAHVDANTKYLSNRLKELKQERFARVFGGSSGPTSNFVSDPAAEHADQKAKLTAENNVGHQMLSGMGWRGGGLGRSGEGVSEPIRASSSGVASDGEGRRAAFGQ